MLVYLRAERILIRLGKQCTKAQRLQPQPACAPITHPNTQMHILVLFTSLLHPSLVIKVPNHWTGLQQWSLSSLYKKSLALGKQKTQTCAVLLQIQQMADSAAAEMDKLLAAKTKELLG